MSLARWNKATPPTLLWLLVVLSLLAVPSLSMGQAPDAPTAAPAADAAPSSPAAKGAAAQAQAHGPPPDSWAGQLEMPRWVDQRGGSGDARSDVTRSIGCASPARWARGRSSSSSRAACSRTAPWPCRSSGRRRTSHRGHARRWTARRRAARARRSASRTTTTTSGRPRAASCSGAPCRSMASSRSWSPARSTRSRPTSPAGPSPRARGSRGSAGRRSTSPPTGARGRRGRARAPRSFSCRGGAGRSGDRLEYRLVMRSGSDLGVVRLPLAFGEKVLDVAGASGFRVEGGNWCCPPRAAPRR